MLCLGFKPGPQDGAEAQSRLSYLLTFGLRLKLYQSFRQRKNKLMIEIL